MNKSSKLFLGIVTVFLLAASVGVDCRRTYSSRSSTSGRGNRGKNQPSSGGAFSSWFGSSKPSSSGSVSKPSPSSSSTLAKKNWQTATSHASTQPKSSWANPYHKPAGSVVPSAPRETNYGWKPNVASNSKPGAPYPSSNIGSSGYPVQSGVPSYAGFKPASGVPQTSYQPSQGSFGGYKPASGIPQTNYQPSQGSFGGYKPASGVPQTSYQPSQGSFGSYKPASGVPQTNYHPSTGSFGAPNTHYQPHSQSYHPSPGHYPTQTGGFASHTPSHSYSGYPSHTTYGASAPSYQGTKLFGGNSGHYGYPGGGNWGVNTYGSKKSSGTGKLLTGLAVGAAGGYLTSSLVNRISNPWRYSGYGYGSGFGGYGSGLGYGPSVGVGLTRDESAFERGYERGARDRLDEKNRATPAPPAPEPEDPTSKWIQCVAFDPQTQQTLINPNCSCTVTTSQDERTGQPLSVHHCTTLNGLVLKPIPVTPEGTVSGPEPSYAGQASGINGQAPAGTNGPAAAAQPPSGLNSPEDFPAYGSIYQGNFEYSGGPTVYLPPLTKTSGDLASSPEASTPEAAKEVTTERKAEDPTTEPKPATTGTVAITEVTTAQKATATESVGTGGSEAESKALAGAGGAQENRKAEFYGQLQKIVNMGNFVDGG